MKYKIITTKSIYWSEDRVNLKRIVEYNSYVEYGKKLPFPTFLDSEGHKITLNPQYVVAIEEYENTLRASKEIYRT